MLRVYILFLVNRMKCLESFPDFFVDIIKLILDPPYKLIFSICLVPNRTSLHKHAFYLLSSAYEHLYLIGCSPCLPHLSTQILLCLPVPAQILALWNHLKHSAHVIFHSYELRNYNIQICISHLTSSWNVLLLCYHFDKMFLYFVII